MITFRKLEDNDDDFKKLHKWCSNKNVYEWFEQRILSLEEIEKKYRNKLLGKKQDLFIIQIDGNDIGLVQIYKYENDIDTDVLNTYGTLYEFDIFIGEEDYLSKGTGAKVINLVKEMIYSNYDADAIILRPFKRNVRAVKCYEKCCFKTLFEYYSEDTLGNDELVIVMLNKKNANN